MTFCLQVFYTVIWFLFANIFFLISEAHLNVEKKDITAIEVKKNHWEPEIPSSSASTYVYFSLVLHDKSITFILKENRSSCLTDYKPLHEVTTDESMCI